MPGSTLTLRGKLTAMTLATIIALVVLFVFLLIDGKQRMMLDRQDKVRNLVEVEGDDLEPALPEVPFQVGGGRFPAPDALLPPPVGQGADAYG